MGGPIDIERKGSELIIHDNEHDFCVTKVRKVDILDSDWGDFRHRRAIDISSFV